MNISGINNSQVITEGFSKDIARFNDPNLDVFNDTSRTQPFDKVLYKELGDATNSLNRQQRDEVGFKPINSGKLNTYLEALSADKGIGKPSKSSILEQYKQYKKDQLLSNPGGDNYFLNKTTGVIDDNYDHSVISKRVGKNFTDAGNNLLNTINNLGVGAKFKYVCEEGNIKDSRKVGLTRTVTNFFKNMASGMTLGLYTPKEEMEPLGVTCRIKHLFKKIFKDALFEDIVKGIPRSVNNVVRDILFVGLNAVETIPDATIGNFESGRKATTVIFDNTQVAMSFVMDTLPGGGAYTRTRSFDFKRGLKGLPIVNNLTTPKDKGGEKEWKYVRNTTFRKTIETIPSFLIPFIRI